MDATGKDEQFYWESDGAEVAFNVVPEAYKSALKTEASSTIQCLVLDKGLKGVEWGFNDKSCNGKFYALCEAPRGIFYLATIFQDSNATYYKCVFGY